MLGGQHARLHRLVGALDLGHVEQAGRVADQHRAGHLDLRQRLVAALDQGAGAGRKDLAAVEQLAHHRVVLELLEGLEGHEARVLVVQAADEAHRHAVLVEVVDEAAAVDLVGQRPADRVPDQARLYAALGQAPQFLQAGAVGLRVAVGIQLVLPDGALGQVAAAALAQHGHRRVDLDALDVGILGIALDIDAHVADDHALDFIGVVVAQVGGGETREQVHTQRLGLRRQPGAQRPERDDEVAVVVLLGRGGQLAAAGLAQVQELVLAGRHADRRRIVAPALDQRIQRPGLDDRAGEDVSADFGGLLDHADVEIVGELLEPNRAGQTGRPGADDHHVVFHDFAFGHGFAENSGQTCKDTGKALAVSAQRPASQLPAAESSRRSSSGHSASSISGWASAVGWMPSSISMPG